MAVKVFNVGDVLAAADLDTWCVPIAGVKSANQITTNNTFINDADMRFSVVANALYEFHVFLWYASPIGADWKSSFTVPAGAVAHFSRYGLDAGGATSVGWAFTDASTVTSQGKGAGTAQTADFFGWVSTAGTAGTLIFQWAQNTTTAGNTTLFQNSYLTGRRIG